MQAMSGPEDVLAFWLDEIGPKGWYIADDHLDQQIRDRFGAVWTHAAEGGCALWMTYASGALAYLILTDQFSRNMHRGSGVAFSTDAAALAVAKAALSKSWDMRIDAPARQFFYLPLMHSESMTDQERSVRMFLTRMPDAGADNLLHAKAHRDVIRRYGRFPYRNDALGRKMTPAEQQFLDDGGYAGVVEALRD